MALKFGSKAWRAKYMKKGKRKTAKKRKNRPNTYTKKGAAYKKKRLQQMIRKNPPRKWTRVKQVRVIRRGGKDILEIRK